MTEKTIYSVSELNATVQQCLQSQFPLLWLEGEISNFSQPRSGHMYLQLKDSQAQIRAAMFSNKNRLLRFTPQNGMQVLVRGRLSLYEPRGDYQFIVEHMEEAGDGALQRAFEELKLKLQNEGLFNDDKKLAIPSLPKSIGIISSPTAAAVQDVIHVLSKRFPQCPVILYPCSVQGDTADLTIIQALQKAHARQECDTLLLVRGGGSKEDLQAFNSETLARNIAALTIPVISGIGHEIDFTIADFVADMRAPTPSAAAEYASPEQGALSMELQYKWQQLNNILIELLKHKQQQLHYLDKRLLGQSPMQQLQNKSQKLDDSEKRLQQALQIRLLNIEKRLQNQVQTLHNLSPKAKIESLNAAFTQQKQLLFAAQKRQVENARTNLVHVMDLLHTVSPLATLERGYSITQNETGSTIQSSKNVSIGDNISIRLAQGLLHAEIKNKH